MKKLIFGLTSGLLFLAACGGNQPAKQEGSTDSAATQASADPSSYEPHRGEGKFDKIELASNLDAALEKKGEEVSNVKCISCHKLSDERLVGPGWKGVTQRRTPQWIMNFITNPDPMIDKDPEVQAQLEICLVRMPNQGLSDDDARNILEFMRQNDGVK